MKKQPIGRMKLKATVYCEVCHQYHRRVVTADVFENTTEAKEAAKKELIEKASKKYICNICKSIIKDMQQ